MKIAEVKIGVGSGVCCIYWKSGNRYRKVGSFVVCCLELDRFLRQFDGIEDLEDVWVTVHDRPAKDRVECVVFPDPEDLWYTVRIPSLNNAELDCGSKMDRRLSRFVGKKLYLQVEYE